jgi:hypothetical protein
VKAKGQKDIEALAVEKEPVRNLGFTTDARAEKKKQAKEKTKAVAREVAFSEVLWQVNQFDYVRTNVEFVHVSSQAPESRSQSLKFNPRQSRDSSRVEVPQFLERPGIELQFSLEQKLFIHEYTNSKFIIDKTSRFNVRPPELCVFDNLLVFYKFFTLGSKKFAPTSKLNLKLERRPWIDGLGGIWKVRRTMLSLAASYLEQKNDCALALELLETIFRPLLQEPEQGTYSTLQSLFVEDNCMEHVIVVPSMVRPLAAVKFFYHLCMTMGHMTTEMDFMNQTTILSSLQAVQMISSDENTAESLKALFKQYVEKDLLFSPVSNTVFQRLLKAANNFFVGLEGNQIVYDPSEEPILESEIAENSKHRLVSQLEERRRNILLSIRGVGIEFPDELILDANSDCPAWDPHIEPFENQAPDSIEEQQIVVAVCKNAIDRKKKGEPFTRFPIIVGPPGTGKTFVMMRMVAYAIAQNLKVNILSMTGNEMSLFLLINLL